MSSLRTTPPLARRRGAKLYLASSAWSQASALLRYVLLARLLGPEQLGLAATLILTASFFDLVSDIGGDRFIIIDRDGGEVRIQALVQLSLVVRGLAVSIALAISAWPVAIFYKEPALGPAIAIFGLAPLIFGFLHLDLRRIQRDNDFRSESLCMFAAETTSLFVSVIAAWLTHSFTSVLYGLILRNLVWVICSHLIAERPYSLAFSKDEFKRLVRFSTPLMLNGLTLFLGGQGDRVLVSRSVGMSGLGHYSAIILLIYYPSAVIQKYVHAVYLPLIAAERADKSSEQAASETLASQTLLLALGMSVGFALVAPFAVSVLYSHAFTVPAAIVALIGILQSSRFLSVWPTTVALAQGQSTIVLANNVVRLIAWPLALIWTAFAPSLGAVVAGFIIGELVAFFVALVMLNRREGATLFHGMGRFVLFMGTSAVTFEWTQPTLPIWTQITLSILTLAIGGLIILCEFSTFRQLLQSANQMLLRFFSPKNS